MAVRAGGKRERVALENKSVDAAFDRLAKHRALHTLVRGALPLATLKRLLKDAMPQKHAREMPAETWSSLAAWSGAVGTRLRSRFGTMRKP